MVYVMSSEYIHICSVYNSCIADDSLQMPLKLFLTLINNESRTLCITLDHRL